MLAHSFSEELNSILLDDELSANMYEGLSAFERSLIKNAIAFHFSYQEKVQENESIQQNKKSGLILGQSTSISPLALFLLPPHFNSIAKLLACICPALIAGVEKICILMYDNVSAGIWASLELLGVENVFVIPTQKQASGDIFYLNQFLNLASSNGENTPVICLEYKNFSDFAKEKLEEIKQCILFDKEEIHILAYKEQEESLLFTHSVESTKISLQEDFEKNLTQSEAQTWQNEIKDLMLKTVPQEQSDTTISFCENHIASQNFKQGMEACYIHPQLSKDSFTHKRIFAFFGS